MEGSAGQGSVKRVENFDPVRERGQLTGIHGKHIWRCTRLTEDFSIDHSRMYASYENGWVFHSQELQYLHHSQLRGQVRRKPGCGRRRKRESPSRRAKDSCASLVSRRDESGCEYDDGLDVGLVGRPVIRDLSRCDLFRFWQVGSVHDQRVPSTHFSCDLMHCIVTGDVGAESHTSYASGCCQKILLRLSKSRLSTANENKSCGASGSESYSNLTTKTAALWRG